MTAQTKVKRFQFPLKDERRAGWGSVFIVRGLRLFVFNDGALF